MPPGNQPRKEKPFISIDSLYFAEQTIDPRIIEIKY
jgi:hypothetical protein